MSSSTTRSAESTGVRQPAKSKIRRHNNRLANVFNRSPLLQDRGQGGRCQPGDLQTANDPAELSSQLSAPGILKIFGSDICQGANYKSVLATTRSSAKELVKEALERYCLEKEDPEAYVLCDVIGQTGADYKWKTECLRVIGDSEKPLMLQSLWKPKEGFSRRFEIQKRTSVEDCSAKQRDTIIAGLNPQVYKFQKLRSRVTSLFVDTTDGEVDSLGIWRSLSDMDLSALGKEACRPNGGTLQDEPEAETRGLSTEKEETESSDDNTTQYSVHLPFDFPYFLLLQGYSYRQDFVIYLMSGNTCVFGCCGEPGEEESLKVDVPLYAPDVLPQHCCVQRLDSGSASPEGSMGTLTVLRPLHGAPVTHNGVVLKDEAELFPGDLVGLGQHYLFMFKDPTAPGTKQTPSWMATLCPPALASACKTCGSSIRRPRSHRRVAARWRDLEGKVLSIPYELEQEDQVLEKILTTVEPGGQEPKLIPAFLLCLCIQHSAASFEMEHFRKLLLQIADKIQLMMWERTKELAVLQPDISSRDGRPEVRDLRPSSTAELIQSLRPLVLWMANSIELLHFVQHEVPLLLPWTRQDEEEEEQAEESLNPQILSTRTASEEAMTVLEEVIMFTFQQTVYYLTKSLYTVLPGLLDSNPFSESGQLRVPEGVGNILDVLKEALELLSSFQVHAEISSQLLAYLFFFTNASLFNILMERGSGGGFYQWCRGVQIRANLDLLMDWTQSIGLGDLAAEFFQKLSSAVNLLASPKETLLQASWASLRAEFIHLNPAQLHHMLREYNPGRACPPCWTPSPEDADAALQTSEILESFDNHPPLILPNSNFHLELGKPISEPAFFSQLQNLQEFIHASTTSHEGQSVQDSSSGLNEDAQSPSSPSALETDWHAPVTTPGAAVHPSPEAEEPQRLSGSSPQVRESHGDLSSCEAVLAQKLKNLEIQSSLPGETDLGYHKSLALDPSCLLTPPNTPQGLELAELEASLQEEAALQAGRQHTDVGLENADLRRKHEEEDEDARDEVFSVELRRGPRGLGLALVDGLKTPLRMSGIYIKSVVPESPAGQCQRLRLGDRILAVNGISLVGLDYQTGREIIRTSGDCLRFLVAKTEDGSSGRSSSTRC